MRKIYYIAILASLSACITRSYDRGVPMRESQVEAVQAAKTKSDVVAALGSPAATNLDGDKWFYFHAEGSRFAFFHPTFYKYRIVEIEFAGGDKVKEVAVRDIKDNDFSTDSRSTTHRDEGIDFFGELFGNIGRFNMAGMGVEPTQE